MRFFSLLLLIVSLNIGLSAADENSTSSTQWGNSEYKKPSWYTVRRLERALNKSKGDPVQYSIEHPTATAARDFFVLDGTGYFWKFPFAETYRYVYGRLQVALQRHLVSKKRFRGDREATVYWTLETLEHIATRRELPEIDNLIRTAAMKLEQQGRMSGANLLRSYWSSSRPYIARRYGKLASLADAIERVKSGKQLLPFPKSDSKKRLTDSPDDHTAHPIRLPMVGTEAFDRFKKYLSDSSIGQQDLVNRVATSIGRQAYYQQLEPPKKPPSDDPNADLIAEEREELEQQRMLDLIKREYENSIYLLGLPGNGKDTFAHDLTDALYGYRGAFLDHLHELPVISDNTKLTQITGTSPIYINSEGISKTARYIATHSGGRYRIETKPAQGRGSVEYIVENEEWLRERKDLDGYWNLPIVLANEWHEWTKKANDDVLKLWIETGVFPISSPNGGVDKMHVKPLFIIAGNWGMRLLSPREKNGSRMGPPPTETQVQENWRLNKDQPEKIKDEMRTASTGVNTPDRDENAKGVSEPFINRIPISHIHLMKPYTQEEIRLLVSRKLEDLSLRLSYNRNFNLNFKATARLLDFVASYRWIPDENARPSKGNIEAIVEDTIMKAIETGNISQSGRPQNFELDIETNKDGTSNLTFLKDGSDQRFAEFIEVTSADRIPEVISDAEIRYISELPDRISEKVVLDHGILEQLAHTTLHSANLAKKKDDPNNPTKKADVAVFFGPTSTGKTLLAKTEIEAMGGQSHDLLEKDLGHISHPQQLTDLLMGPYNSIGEGQPSWFTKHFDFRNGKNIYVLLDELSNAPKEAWMPLYEITREPRVKNFAFGGARNMGDTKIRITANIGKEWYDDIPKDAPEMQRMFAAQKIYKQAVANPQYLESFALTKLPQPLYARLGLRNIYWMPPLDFEKVRRVAQIKILGSIKNLDYAPGKRWWKIGFQNLDGYKKFLEDVEVHGFEFSSQGQSLETFVTQEFETRLDVLLLQKLVPVGSKITIIPRGTAPASTARKEKKQVLNYDLYIENQAEPIPFTMKAKNIEGAIPESKVNRILTDIHEAGHELVRHVLFKDKVEAIHLSSIPGIANFGQRWLMYLGIAESERKIQSASTLDTMINEAAVLHGGYIAESMATKGGMHTAGKANDIQRATQILKMAVVRFGLVEKWGTDAVPEEKSMEEYVASFSEERKRLLDDIVADLMKQAALRARAAILKNRDNILVPLAVNLAIVGDMGPQAIADFYKNHQPNYNIGEGDLKEAENFKPEAKRENLFFHEVGEPELASWFPIEKVTKIASLDDFVKASRDGEVANVKLSDEIQFYPVAGLKTNECGTTLAAIAAAK